MQLFSCYVYRTPLNHIVAGKKLPLTHNLHTVYGGCSVVSRPLGQPKVTSQVNKNGYLSPPSLALRRQTLI
jgi:hypothetical protein